MPERNLQFELTLRNAEIIRFKDIITILENVIQNDENLLNKARKTIVFLKKEHARLNEMAKVSEIEDIKMKMLLIQLEKIDHVKYT